MADGLRKGLTSYGDAGFSLFLRKAFIKAMGYSDDALNRPIVGITNTYSDYNPCHGNVPQIIEAVKRGVMLSGAMPFVFPTISIAESFAHPTSMYLRNLMAMDTEEMIRAQPMDAVVVIGGCDKTLPAQIMAAISADLPTVVIPVGPMVVGHHKGEVLGACTDCRRLWGKYRAGEIDDNEIEAVNGRLAPSVGTCMVMGTASTMACITEALGLSLPMSATIPAPHAERFRSAEASGLVAAEMAKTRGPKPSEILTPSSFRNAQVVMQAIGGSTNGLIHLTAIANRSPHKIDLEAFDKLGREVPVLVDLKPSGEHYMEHFHHAGGVPKLMAQLGDLIDLDAKTITGQTLREVVANAEDVPGQDAIRSKANPIKSEGAMAILHGNLAPRGAVIKHSAASPKLLQHTGRAVVFESVEDMTLRVDDPALDVTADDVLVLRNAGPKGAPGMPEAGYLPIPKKLARAGVKDMVRISDARMSGTAFGTIVLHITPESAVGGPLGLVRNGDMIRLDVAKRSIDLLVDEAELQKRRAALAPAGTPDWAKRGYAHLFNETILQADEGCDFDFMRAKGK
ncbi:IlvD/Edd family dehydratase [Bradyrhizobium elkanii]|uniref:Dihydroxy-acid dehydratase n=1 Tax=Bradyrhizobium elkanii TaxID=29448 RepID=A0ABV4EVW3_BRAEL|nr:IlvD/Edd family dehydratase [Bradyrhizobium elkanii]MCP1756319.1 dihydroxy-acid dehydratase [Bradyrhizobium elkanii]MCP1981832.1 dihydroxy-acid dehydratase [Bradyrhizobium elkanii]MCS3883384.1 dihydroxy-acid dehydratase [Bradyrhizobium elkanii]MCS4217559.1 dihydroxy-acid dehydratase [Bradyrhizobium elkanii]MCW2195979.1 dihydroxy-acid dehydratase [Bradyrhizobium elkanii]